MVGKSKVISGLSTHQAHRRRKDTIMGSQVGPDAYSQYRDPKGTIGELFLPTFHAGLTNNTDAKTPGGIVLPGTVARATSATYNNIRNELILAAPNESRQEFSSGQPLGTLMEPASTNKCTNYNANPDAALTNISTQGDAAGVMSRVADVAALTVGGLSALVPEGFVVKLDNTGGSGVFEALIEGSAVNTNDHMCSIFWRGSGNARLRLTGTVGSVVALPSAYERYSVKQTPAAGTNRLRITAEPGAVLFFILNQLEEQPAPTSPIITSGSSTSRATDQLQWASSGVLNQIQGMAAILWRPGFSGDDMPNGSLSSGPILRLTASPTGGDFLYFQKETAGDQRFINYDGTTYSLLEIPGGFIKDRVYAITLRWTGAVKQLAFKAAGSWVQDIEEPYDGAFPDDGSISLSRYAGFAFQAPTHSRDLYFWDEDKGQAWLESFFSGMAN